jgi:hypothetical protein
LADCLRHRPAHPTRGAAPTEAQPFSQFSSVLQIKVKNLVQILQIFFNGLFLK